MLALWQLPELSVGTAVGQRGVVSFHLFNKRVALLGVFALSGGQTARPGSAKGCPSSEQQGKGTDLKTRYFFFSVLLKILLMSQLLQAGNCSDLPLRTSGLSKPQKRPLGRLWASGGLCWRMQNVGVALGSTPGGSLLGAWSSARALCCMEVEAEAPKIT